MCDAYASASGPKFLIRIETSGAWRATCHTELSFVVLQHALGGDLEFIGLQRSDGLIAYCDEDGRNKRLQLNLVAQERLSVIFAQECPSIVGPILLSRIDEDGHEVGLTSDDLVLLTSLTCLGPESR